MAKWSYLRSNRLTIGAYSNAIQNCHTLLLNECLKYCFKNDRYVYTFGLIVSLQKIYNHERNAVSCKLACSI